MRQKILIYSSLLLIGLCATAQVAFAQGNANGWTVQNLVQFVSADLNRMWTAEFEERGLTYQGPNAVVAYNGRVRTPCGTVRVRTALYCSASHSIYYDIFFMKNVLNQIGDFGVAAIIAHEWAHAVQLQTGLFGIASVDNELMADCMAGGYAHYAESTGVLEEGDYEEGRNLFSRIGDPPNTDSDDPNAHGSAEERVAAYDGGFRSGVDSCF